MSVLTIVSLTIMSLVTTLFAIVVALPTEVTLPVKLALVVTVDALPNNDAVTPVTVIWDVNAKLSPVSPVVKLLEAAVPAKSMTKLPYVIFLLPDVRSPASSFTKNLSVVSKPDLAVVGNDAVAVTPVNPAPEPLNDPVNDPVKAVVACEFVITWFEPTCNDNRWALLPETITFFHSAIICFFFF